MKYCSYCGFQLNQGESFCKVCGTQMDLAQNNTLNTPNEKPQDEQVQDSQVTNLNELCMNFEQPINTVFQNYIQMQNNELTNNLDRLIDAYIGKNAEILKKERFSTSTFLFGTVYFFYRKMWFLGFIWEGIIIILSFLSHKLAFIISSVITIYFSIHFKELYFKNVKKQVEKIKNENTDKTYEELLQICSQKGGTSIIPVIIEITLSIGAFIAYILIILDMFE